MFVTSEPLYKGQRTRPQLVPCREVLHPYLLRFIFIFAFSLLPILVTIKSVVSYSYNYIAGLTTTSDYHAHNYVFVFLCSQVKGTSQDMVSNSVSLYM